MSASQRTVKFVKKPQPCWRQYPIINGKAFGKWPIDEPIPVCDGMAAFLREKWRDLRFQKEWGYFHDTHG